MVKIQEIPWVWDPVPDWWFSKLSDAVKQKIKEAQIAQVEVQLKAEQERIKQSMMIIKMLKESR
jgi:hypothetical protein